MHECHPYVRIIDEYAKFFAKSVKCMNRDISDVIEQCSGKHKCPAEEFRHIRKLWGDAVKALERTINTARNIHRQFKFRGDRRNEVLVSIELCEECVNETGRLLTSGCEANIICEAETGDQVLIKRLAKILESYAASINQTVKTLAGKVSSNEVQSCKGHNFSEEAFQNMQTLCRSQAEVSYSAAEISAYFKNLVISFKNKK